LVGPLGIGPISVDGGGGNDTLIVDGFSNQPNSFYFNGGLGVNALVVNDQAIGGVKNCNGSRSGT